jgi:hypothetical protein
VPYLLLGLQDVQWAVGNSHGARKLARTPHVNQKKNNNNKITGLIIIKFGLKFIGKGEKRNKIKSPPP